MADQSDTQESTEIATGNQQRGDGRPAGRLVIKRLTVRDCSFIAANMRDHDRAEICCQFETWDTRVFATTALQCEVPGMSWSVWLDNQPTAAYGFSRISPFDPDKWQAWAFGTKDFKRCLPIMTRHLTEIRPIVERDCRRLQAIAHVDHDIAHGWIESFGARREGLLRAYGRGGEDFVVYGWVGEYAKIERQSKCNF